MGHVQMGMKVDNSISEGFFSETQNNGSLTYFRPLSVQSDIDKDHIYDSRGQKYIEISQKKSSQATWPLIFHL